MPARQRSSEILLFTGREPGGKGFLDAAHELHADAQVGGAICQLLEGKREVHRLALLAGWKREPIAQMSGILLVVPVHLGDGMAPATRGSGQTIVWSITTDPSGLSEMQARLRHTRVSAMEDPTTLHAVHYPRELIAERVTLRSAAPVSPQPSSPSRGLDTTR